MDNIELYHHGVKGMRWGIRRYQNKDGSLTALGKKRANKLEAQYEKLTGGKPKGKTDTSSTNNDVERPKPKKISELSNDEIQARIDRMNLEKRYQDLVKAQSTTPKNNKGKEFIMSVLEKSGKNIAEQTATYLLGVGANKVLEQITGDAKAIDPKKGQKEKK